MSEVLKVYGAFVGEAFEMTVRLADARISPELRDAARYHLSTLAQSKGMRPALVRAAANVSGWSGSDLVMRAAAVQLAHEAMLIIDDILDGSEERRGLASLVHRFGHVQAAAVAAEFTCIVLELLDDDRQARAMARRLTRETCAAEALQDQERAGVRPLPIATWQRIALGDTGAIFRMALWLGGVQPEGCLLADSLAYLRHGLDDIDDILDPHGDQADVRDNVPTLLTCFTDKTARGQLMAEIPAALGWLEPHLHAAERLPGLWRTFAPFFTDLGNVWRQFAGPAAA